MPPRRLAGPRIRLQELREARGWSQAELARRSGVGQGYISRIEAGKIRSIHLDNLAALAKALGVPIALLIAE